MREYKKQAPQRSATKGVKLAMSIAGRSAFSGRRMRGIGASAMMLGALLGGCGDADDAASAQAAAPEPVVMASAVVSEVKIEQPIVGTGTIAPLQSTDLGPRVCDCPECPRYLWPIDLGEHYFDIFHLYIRQYGDGHRAIAGCGGTVAFGELWGHVLGDYSGWFRYPHVCANT